MAVKQLSHRVFTKLAGAAEAPERSAREPEVLRRVDASARLVTLL